MEYTRSGPQHGQGGREHGRRLQRRQRRIWFGFQSLRRFHGRWGFERRPRRSHDHAGGGVIGIDGRRADHRRHHPLLCRHITAARTRCQLLARPGQQALALAQIALAAILTISASSAVLNTNEMMPCPVTVRRIVLSVMPTSDTCAVMPITKEKYTKSQ